jgi:hypothetical protein
VLIARGQQIAGFEAVTLRGWLKELRAPRTCGSFATAISLSRAEASRILDQLRAHSLVEQLDEPTSYGGRWSEEGEADDTPVWAATVDGNAISKARIGKKMPRSKADQVLAELIRRIADYNAADDRFYNIEWAEVFGRYQRGDDLVGDIDVHALAVLRFDGDEHERRRVGALRRPDVVVGGRTMDQLAWPYAQMLKQVRGRSAVIDLQLDDNEPRPLPNGCITTVVYERSVGCRSLWPAAIAPWSEAIAPNSVEP